VDTPQLVALIRSLAEMRADDLDSNLHRVLDILPVGVK
jgi:hypothetical protein